MHSKASKAKAPDTKQSPEKQEQKIMLNPRKKKLSPI
jgi:hypothetical protein